MPAGPATAGAACPGRMATEPLVQTDPTAGDYDPVAEANVLGRSAAEIEFPSGSSTIA